MAEGKTTVVRTEIPDSLLLQAQNLVDGGWFRSLDELIHEALRHYVEAYRAELKESFIRQDVEWGLRGEE